MPSVTVGNIRIVTTFKSGIKYTKTGEMVTENFVYTSYRNLDTGRTATTAELNAVGIKNRQRPSVKLSNDNAEFLFNKALRAEAGEIKAKHYANLLGSKTYGLPTDEQFEQFKDALKSMFKDANPSAEELEEWNAMVDSMTSLECQQFYDRYQRDIRKGFKGYHSTWTTIDTDDMGAATADQVRENYRRQAEAEEVIELQKVNRDTTRPKLMDALRSFLQDKGHQTTLHRFV